MWSKVRNLGGVAAGRRAPHNPQACRGQPGFSDWYVHTPGGVAVRSQSKHRASSGSTTFILNMQRFVLVWFF